MTGQTTLPVAAPGQPPDRVVALLDIRVHGTPRPKGSLRPFVTEAGKPRVREQLPGSPDWRRAVTEAAHDAIRCAYPDQCDTLRPGYPHDGPVAVHIDLQFPRPKSRRLPMPSTRTTGDADKHARQILDALQDAGVVRDDAQVVDLTVVKRYTDGAPGAGIVVWPSTQESGTRRSEDGTRPPGAGER